MDDKKQEILLELIKQMHAVMSESMEDEKDVSEVVEDAKDEVLSREDSMVKDALGDDEEDEEEMDEGCSMQDKLQELISGGGKFKPEKGVVKIDIMGKRKQVLDKAPEMIKDIVSSMKKKGKRSR